MSMEPLKSASLRSMRRVHGGKVRDIFAVDEAHWLIVASDRLSAFDVVLPDPIPGKGCILTQISRFWFEKTRGIVPNHMVSLDLQDVVKDKQDLAQIRGRAMVVRKLRALPVEAVVRGYLIGSGWKDYQRYGQVCEIELPSGLPLAAQLPEPIFTPATKAKTGDHDENISYGTLIDLIGENFAAQIRDLSLELYRYAYEHAYKRGIIIADTKFEFGVDEDGSVTLIDEALTPDSSRFWPLSEYRTGISPPSFDKQFVRDYLETVNWNKQPPGPHLPPEIISKTAAKYREAEERLLAPDT